MTCSVCTEFAKTNQSNQKSNLTNQYTFITGCTNLRVSAVTDHETSKGHLKAVASVKGKTSSHADKMESTAGKTLMSLKSAERYRLAYLFRNAHAVAKRNRPLSDYSWLCSADKAKGLDIGETYLNDKAALDFIFSIAEGEKIKTVQQLDQAPYFSFMMDGSTDISGDEQETIYVRSSLKGSVTERFLSIGTPVSTCSNDLYEFVVETVKQFSINTDKLAGMGSDGASNMTGSKARLITILRHNVNNEIVNIHCLAYRLALAFRDVVKKSKLYNKLMTLLIGLHYFYKRQYKNKSGLQRSMKALDIDGVLPPKVTGTRWLPHLSRGISCFLRSYKAIEAHLSTASHQNPKAEGMLKIMLDVNLMAYVLFLQDVIDPLMKLSLKFQRTESTLSDCLVWVESTLELLDETKSRDNKQLSEILESRTLYGVTLKGSTPSMAYKDELVKGLSEAIKTRFQAIQFGKSVVDATKILKLKIWPSDKDELRDFGNDEFKGVLAHFSSTLRKADPEFSDENALSEWILLKKVLSKRHGQKLNTCLAWSDLLKDDEDFKSASLVIDLLLSLPPTSGQCEASFSQMKLIKTSRRTKLRSSTLNALLTVKLESSEVDKYCPDEGIDRWMATAQRRPHYKRCKSQINQKAATVVQILDDDLITENNDRMAEKVQQSESVDEAEPDSDDEVDYINGDSEWWRF